MARDQGDSMSSDVIFKPEVVAVELEDVQDMRTSTEALADCVETFKKWIYLPDVGCLYVTVAAAIANEFPGEPEWLLLVAPPSSGKSEILMSLRALPNVHFTSALTEAGLLSGTSKKDKSANATGGLLREIGEFGIVAMKDFGSVLSMHHEKVAQVLAALREISDGSWTRSLGTDGGRSYSWAGKMGLVAGVTPIVDAHLSVMSVLGDRFLLYRFPRALETETSDRALSNEGDEKEMREELMLAVQSVYGRIDRTKIGKAPKDTRDRITNLAIITVHARSGVERDWRHEITLIPEAESPPRVAKQLLKMLNSLRAIGVEDTEAWRLTIKCALDSIPNLRRQVLEFLLASERPLSTLAIAGNLGYPEPTVRRALEDLKAHDVLRRDKVQLNNANLWQVSDWVRDRWSKLPGVTVVPAQAELAQASAVGLAETM